MMPGICFKITEGGKKDRGAAGGVGVARQGGQWLMVGEAAASVHNTVLSTVVWTQDSPK